MRGTSHPAAFKTFLLHNTPLAFAIDGMPYTLPSSGVLSAVIEQAFVVLHSQATFSPQQGEGVAVRNITGTDGKRDVNMALKRA